MGGTTFTQQAERMSTATLDTIQNHITSRLAATFPKIDRMHHVRSKECHGDLDLICALPSDVEIPLRRQDVGLMSIETPSDGHTVGEMVAKMSEHQRKCYVFAQHIAAKVGAQSWMIAFYGYPLLVLSIPSVLLTSRIQGDGMDHKAGFYQIDLGLIPLPSFPSYRLFTSYSIPYACIVLALQSLSPLIWLRRDGLVLRHSAIAGQPMLEIRLTEPEQLDLLVGWLGLDLVRWEEGFDAIQDVWEWLVDIDEQGVLNKAWHEVKEVGMDRMKVDWKRFHTRVDGVSNFVAWLQSRSESNQIASQSSHDSTKAPRYEYFPPSTDPDRPSPLDSFAASTLAFFDKRAEYDQVLQRIQVPALAIIRRQKERQANREADQKRQEERRLRIARAVEAEAATSTKAVAGTGEDDSNSTTAASSIIITPSSSAESILKGRQRAIGDGQDEVVAKLTVKGHDGKT